MKITPKPHKPLVWVASTKKELMALPVDIRSFFGHALDLAQRGDRYDSAKVLHGFGCAGVLEIIDDGVGGTYRTVYTVKFEEAVFVLHCFQKKSKSGIATPQQEMTLVRARLQSAQQWIEELRHEKTHSR